MPDCTRLFKNAIHIAARPVRENKEGTIKLRFNPAPFFFIAIFFSNVCRKIMYLSKDDMNSTLI